MINLKNTLRSLIAASCLTIIAAPASAGQANSTSLCVGGPGNIISFSSSLTPDDTILLRFGNDKSVDLPNSYSGEVKAVCRVALDRAVVFNWLTGAYSISILDLSTWSIIDSFQAYTPSLSPSGSFLAYREFYSYHTDSPICEMYVIYDLRKGPNKQRSQTPNGALEIVGKVVYPINRNNELFEPYLVSQTRVHRFASEGFFWSDDESAVVFGDSVLDQLQLVMVDPNSRLGPRVKPLKQIDVCKSGPTFIASDLMLKDAQVGHKDNFDRPVIATFGSGSVECHSQPVTFLSSLFDPATVEDFTPPSRVRGKAIQKKE